MKLPVPPPSVSFRRSITPLPWRRLRLAFFPVCLLAGMSLAPGAGAQTSTAAASTAAVAKGNLLAVIKAAGKYNTFLKVVDAAGLTSTLEQAGPYTVMAPTDEAFSKLPPGALDRFLKPENKAKLLAIVNYHIAPGRMALAALTKVDELKTLNGEEIDVDTSTDGKTIEMDDSKIIAPDLEASNGVVHGIDAVLQP